MVQSLNCVQFFATPWTVAHQAPLSMGFPRQAYWSGLLLLPPGDLLIQGWSPGLPGWQWILYPWALRTDCSGLINLLSWTAPASNCSPCFSSHLPITFSVRQPEIGYKVKTQAMALSCLKPSTAYLRTENSRFPPWFIKACVVWLWPMSQILCQNTSLPCGSHTGLFSVSWRYQALDSLPMDGSFLQISV